MTEDNGSQKAKNGLTDIIAIKVLGALLVIAIATIVSGYSSTFIRTEQFNKFEKEMNDKNNKLNTKITVLETNYANILSHLKTIKESIIKK